MNTLRNRKLRLTSYEGVYKTLNVLFALSWIISGLYGKILGFIPRHQQIVAQIITQDYAGVFTILVGFAECFLAITILRERALRSMAIVQVLALIVINALEVDLVPELLLWGRLNLLFAIIFSGVIIWNEFWLKLKLIDDGY